LNEGFVVEIFFAAGGLSAIAAFAETAKIKPKKHKYLVYESFTLL